MNIAYLSTFYPYRGGIAQFNANLYRELEKTQNVNAYTFSLQYPEILFPGSSQYVTKDDIVDKINAKPVINTINPISYITAANQILRDKPDVAITKFWLPFFAPALGTVLKKLRKQGAKNISILDNVIPHEKRPFDISLIKYYLNSNDYFIAMSNAVKADLLSLKPDAEVKLLQHPLYNHFGAKKAKKEAKELLNLPDGKKLLLYFGFIRDYKGLDILIESLTNLPEDYHLIIAGEVYGSFDKYDTLIQKHNLADRIHKFVRYISDNEVPLFFSAADVCVLSYKSATQSGITGISHHFDLPLVATNVGGLEEIIGRDYTGIIVDKVSSEAVAGGIKVFFNSDINFTGNIAEMKQKLSWENFAKEMLDFNTYG